MFVTIKNRVALLDKQIEYFNINREVLSGKRDNPNGYSRDYILGVMTDQCKLMHRIVDEIKEMSTNQKLIRECEKKIEKVAKDFMEV